MDSCALAWCRLVQTRVFSLTGGGVSLHPRVRYFSTSGGNIRGNGGSGGLPARGVFISVLRPCLFGLEVSLTAADLAKQTPLRLAVRLPMACHNALFASCMRAAGQGLTLLPGTYTHPLSFTGLYNLTQWALRLMVGKRQQCHTCCWARDCGVGPDSAPQLAPAMPAQGILCTPPWVAESRMARKTCPVPIARAPDEPLSEPMSGWANNA